MKLTVTALILNLCVLSTQNSLDVDDSDIINPEWIKPSFGNRQEYEQRQKLRAGTRECQCPEHKCEPPEHAQCATAEQVHPVDENNRLAMVFYKKFVLRLFDSQLIREQDSELFLRNLQLKITHRQLEELKQAKNARDIDGIVASVIEQSKDSLYHSTAESFCLSFTVFYEHVIRNTFFLYITIPTLGLLGVYLVAKGLARVMHVHPLFVILLMLIVISFAIAFRDCNRRLETESLVRLMRADQGNPCNTQRGAAAMGGLLGWIKIQFGEDDEAKCLKHLRESMGASEQMCDPLQVSVELLAKLQSQYFKSLLQEIIKTFKETTAASGWIEKGMIGGIIGLLLYFLITNLVKYGIYGSSNFLVSYLTHSPRSSNHAQNALPYVDGQQQQLVPTVPPTSVNLKINIARTNKKKIRVETNRIEEIAESNEPKPQILEVIESCIKGRDEGFGDAPTLTPTVNEENSEPESDYEDIYIECKIPKSASDTEVLPERATDNQSNSGST